MNDKTIIAGIGNLYRGDDAAGWKAIEVLSEILPSSISLLKSRGDISELMEIFTDYSSVYLIDASLSDNPEIPWQRIDVLRQPLPEDNRQTSTHGFSISQAVALARNLNQLPPKLILYAIAGSDFTVGAAMALAAAQAVEQVVNHLLLEEDIQTCMKQV